jgi:hypothetical protein
MMLKMVPQIDPSFDSEVKATGFRTRVEGSDVIDCGLPTVVRQVVVPAPTYRQVRVGEILSCDDRLRKTLSTRGRAAIANKLTCKVKVLIVTDQMV